MSYCRFGWEGSDVYIFEHVGGFIQCCACSLNEKAFESTNLETYDAMIAHVQRHIAEGHKVPDTVIPELEADRDALSN